MQPNSFNVTTLLMASVTVWVLFVRWRSRHETNWPLLYYAALFAYTKKFDEIVDPWALYIAVVCALLIRFEYLSGWMLQAIQVLETICLIYVLARCVRAVFGYF